MEGHPDSGVAALAIREGDLAPLANAFRAALGGSDLPRARALMTRAAAAGTSAGALYVGAVRPGLVDLQGSGHDARSRWATETILSDLVSLRAAGRSSGAGRAAVLCCREHGIQAVDGGVAMDFLQADGWSVDRLRAGPSLPDAAAAASAGIELVVAITEASQDAAALGRACAGLRRLTDPPVTVLCDFSARPETRAASMALGADAVARDPEELVGCAARQLPASGQRRWGVRLSRLGAMLSLTPTGCLDSPSVGRLADVAFSRSGTYSRLVVDLRDLAEVRDAGLRRFAGWPNLPALLDVDLVAVAGSELRRALTAYGYLRPLRIVNTAEEAATASLA